MKKIQIYTWPYCGYCVMAKSLLTERGYNFLEEDISNNPEKKAELMKLTGQRTVPYIFINGEFIGGCSDLSALDDAGRLSELMGE